MEKKLRLAVIYGSTREGRLCDRVVDWIANEVWTREQFELDLIDPGEFDLHGTGKEGKPSLAAAGARLDEADAFIITTPEYNHSFPAPLKAFIDAFSAEWQVKPLAFVSYGGISGGLRAVEQLRLVFAELHAVAIRDTVSFAHAWGRFSKDGELREPEEAHKSMGRLIANLHWWAGVLRPARAEGTYGVAA
ncbi:NAD(P)H-dependent oxidoreductase [Aquamicrobium sp. LC103]|uniref:NADPH-dependent FMN reductase n=1 Tax=Aquamicrobium sp. LC103 TaxID=1120658 RepID=UPI00063EA4C3|nr:NAD(P)H-dependent oxidoreductase [Aquamicrobium sp. LC103]TKT77594.1 NAD(P)H-dependent oxidoreductase [Aquamicrobium sp. LC103]